MNEIQLDKKIDNRIQQGDILRNIEFIQKYEYISDDEIKLEIIKFPFVIVLTQDCDLKQNSEYFFNNPNPPKTDDKRLLSVIVAPIYNEELFILGDHLKSLKLKMQTINKVSKGKLSTSYKNLTDNQNPRYHYLKFKENDSIPDSVIDFKQYFTVSLDILIKKKKGNFVGKIPELYREDISQRFANFLSRIGLPDNTVQQD